jgi:putative ABC transport system permease protein
MLKHFFITGLRNFWRNKSSTILNILGLAIGMATTLLILEYIFNELSYERFHKNKNDIYRVIVKQEKEGAVSPTAYLTAAVAPSMAQDFPEVEYFVRFANPTSGYVSFNDHDYKLESITYADSALFDVFSFPLLKGNPKTALANPYQVVLSASSARKIFGDEDPIGKMIRLNNKESLVVSGVVADFPANSQLQFDALISFSTLYLNPNYFLDWDGGYNYFTYVQLVKGTDILALKAKFSPFMEKNINYKYRPLGFVMYLDLQPLARIHLYSKKDAGIDEAGDLQGLYIFSCIAIFILLIACINFMNLTTARSLSRAREVGLRKVSGATRRNISFQFLFETLLISILAFLISFILVDAFQGKFNQLMGKDLSIFGPAVWKMLGGMTLLILVTGLLAGSYPAWFMSHFPPLLSIRGTMVSGKGKSVLRNVLVIFQFLISIVLIILTVVIFSQMKYINSIPLGFNRDNVVVIPMVSENTMRNYKNIKDAFNRIPQVTGTGASSEIPGYGFTMNGYFPEGAKEPIMIHVLDVDEDYLKVMEIPVVQGRSFDPGTGADSSAYLINETLARQLNWDNPTGKVIYRDGAHKVIGVVSDFHFASLHESIQPLIITKQPWIGYSYLSVRIRPENSSETIHKMESAWASVFPDEPFDSFPQEEFIKGAYTGVRNTGEAIFWFSLLAIFIAGLGLLGLANFTFNQRKKEIGIRKILGAESANIARKFTFDFLRLVILASIIALPLAWWIMNKWMENFAYRAYISFWVFLLPVIIVTILAWSTIYFQVRKLANTNPVDVLKFE